ncbi:sulfurtransferase [Nocardioides yefusunii]|uniref:tRNA uridine(34) hydroxylase n=1 Tax=Nocardioides yefusunii TaxID=2500546 RepID=A0ABW1QRS1_9ACTN|nr:sulfurtransferase [Nocardioides yefusunii]
MTSDAQVLNISAYLFVEIDDLDALRAALLQRCNDAGLRGTILLAREGINMFLAGDTEPLRGFLDLLRTDDRFATLEAKESWSDTQPFRKMLVKVKNEIIRMDHPTIRPMDGRGRSVAPTTLKRWLDQGHDDEGREVLMLDTRNAFEVDYGTFRNTVDFRIEKFTEFPQAVLDHREDLEGRTVVSFCTGGIRCEKTSIYMAEQGFENVLQLEGGILKYFEEVGGDHWDGSCFVFDEREALLPDLTVWDEPTRREPRGGQRVEGGCSA